jgi:hypothetical protein
MPARVRLTSSSNSNIGMFQTILGIVVLVVGLAGVVFNRRLASAHRDFNRWALGLELSFSPDGDRAGIILVGLGFMILGLLIALHVVPAA